MMWCMRTTVTLDDDVARALERMRAEERITLRQAINAALREGLAARARRGQEKAAPIRTTQPRDLGPHLTNFDNASDLIALVEGDAYK